MKLPDVNVLVAWAVADHVHHALAADWVRKASRFGTCPITELGLVRVLMQLGAAAADAYVVLDTVVRRHRERLIPADVSASVTSGKVEGHRQTTDVYLVELARAHKLVVVTFDRTLAGRFPGFCQLVAEPSGR